MKNSVCARALCVAWLLWASSSVSAQEQQVSVAAARDTTIYANDDTLGDGKGSGLFCGPNGQRAPRRALVWFDVASALPPGVTITNAVLKLQLTRTHPALTTISVHRLTADWGEGGSQSMSGGGGSGSAAASNDATWSHRMWPDQSWAHAGGDYAEEPSAKADILDLGSYSWSGANLARDAQRFLDDASSNFGWILIGETPERAVAKRFSSREDPQGVAPELLLTYAPPPVATGACCRADGGCGIVLDPGNSCQGSYLGTGSLCAAGACPEPTGACCVPDAQATCEVRKKSECPVNQFRGIGASCEPNPCPVVLTPFVDELPLPGPAKPIDGESGGEATYRMSMFQTQQKFHRDLPATTVWGFSDGNAGGYPGPTLEARSGKPVSVIWANDLRDARGRPLDTHPLAVDHCLHGAHGDAPRTVVHLHGGHVPAGSDGYPEATLMPGEEVRYEYPNIQRAATIWYHDHAVGITRLNVYMGLAGFYLIRDEEEEALHLPSGEYEVPLAIQDRSFYPDGRLRYPAAWQENFFGDNAVVNGKVSPFLRVKRGLYRFRILNGSTSRAYTLSLSNGQPFVQIGNDGGLLPESISVRSVTITPGERADVVIDFRFAGGDVTLKNSARSPYPAGGADAAPLENILRFVVADEPGHTLPVLVKLSSIPAIDESASVMTRDLTLKKMDNAHCGNGMWTVDGRDWDEITEKPLLGTSEVWRFMNQSGVTHPMHLHALFFRVLDRQSHKLVAGKLEPQGEPTAPRRNELGWKDTVQVGPFEAVRVLARFEDFAGRFPYHCHLLEHEDHGMMRQFEVQSPCGDGVVAPGIEQCDDGNTADGDGCSASCQRETSHASATQHQKRRSERVRVDSCAVQWHGRPGRLSWDACAWLFGLGLGWRRRACRVRKER